VVEAALGMDVPAGNCADPSVAIFGPPSALDFPDRMAAILTLHRHCDGQIPRK
jgi:hypothetical protein